MGWFPDRPLARDSEPETEREELGPEADAAAEIGENLMDLFGTDFGAEVVEGEAGPTGPEASPAQRDGPSRKVVTPGPENIRPPDLSPEAALDALISEGADLREIDEDDIEEIEES